MTDPKDLLRIGSTPPAVQPAQPAAPYTGEETREGRPVCPTDLTGTLFGIARDERRAHLVVHLDDSKGPRVALVFIPTALVDLWAALHREAPMPTRLALAVESCGAILIPPVDGSTPVVSMPFGWHVRYLGERAIHAVQTGAAQPVVDHRYTVRRLTAEVGYAYGPVLLAAREAPPAGSAGGYGRAPTYRPPQWVGIRVPEAFVAPWVDVMARCIARDIFIMGVGSGDNHGTAEDAVTQAVEVPDAWHAEMIAAFDAAVPRVPTLNERLGMSGGIPLEIPTP